MPATLTPSAIFSLPAWSANASVANTAAGTSTSRRARRGRARVIGARPGGGRRTEASQSRTGLNQVLQEFLHRRRRDAVAAGLPGRRADRRVGGRHHRAPLAGPAAHADLRLDPVQVAVLLPL